MRGIDEYMRGTGRLLRAGVEKVWGPGRHMAGNNTFSYFLDPHGNTIEYTTELEQFDEDTWHPHLYDFSDPSVTDQWGTANPMSEFVAKQSFNDPDRGVFVAPPGLMRLATYRHAGASGRRRRATTGCTRSPDGARPWCALVSTAAPAGPHVAACHGVPLAEVRLLAAVAAADRSRLRRFRGARRGCPARVDGTGGVPEAWYDAPTFYFTNPHTLLGPDDDVPFPAASLGPRLRAGGRRRDRATGR